MLRLGFHYHIAAAAGADGKIRVPGYLGRFLDAVAAHCRELVLMMHETKSSDVGDDNELQSANINWVKLGPAGSVPSRVARAPRVRRMVQPWRNSLDAVLLRGPSPLLPTIAAALRPLPVALLLVGDQLAGVDDLRQPRWRKELIRLFWRWNSARQDALARRSLVFANNPVLLERYRGRAAVLKLTRTTTLFFRDFFEREDTCQGRPIKLLYTGRYSFEKGLVDMVVALGHLVRSGLDMQLHLVGWEEPGSGVVAALKNEARSQGVADRLFDHGFKPVGPLLFDHYKQADIYVIASRSSFEGFPRTVWEAMAHSLPVVATRVGSLPDVLRDRHSALLVEAKSPEHIAAAVEELAATPALRRQLILGGRETAKESTLEFQVAKMVGEITDFVRNQHV